MAEGQRRRYRCTTDSGHQLAIKGNVLARRFAVEQPNTAWSPTSLICGLWKVGCIYNPCKLVDKSDFTVRLPYKSVRNKSVISGEEQGCNTF